MTFSDVIHKFTRDNYLKRFPELESLVNDPLQYVSTVKVRNDCIIMPLQSSNLTVNQKVTSI